MRRVAYGTILTALILCPVGRGAPGAGDAARVKPEAATLNPAHPAASFPIERETLASSPPILRVSITKVVNPARTPVGVYVYLSPSQGSGETLVGNFALFPPGHPGGFLLGTSKAFAELRERGYTGEVRLRIELKRIHPAKPWTPLEVRVAPPQWLRE